MIDSFLFFWWHAYALLLACYGPIDHGAFLPSVSCAEGDGEGFRSALPLFMFLVFGTDYVDVTFSADGLFGMLAMGFSAFPSSPDDVEGREGIGGTRDRLVLGCDFGLMGTRGGPDCVPCTHHTSS